MVYFPYVSNNNGLIEFYSSLLFPPSSFSSRSIPPTPALKIYFYFYTQQLGLVSHKPPNRPPNSLCPWLCPPQTLEQVLEKSFYEVF